MNGLRVIPTIAWSDKSSHAWCFDGEPHGGVVAVYSVGSQRPCYFGAECRRSARAIS